ncbi:hypothetical protein UFOVP75_209 [uncultured Caudovirales phage]|uniref:Uncharacterized protein n=1 Tax=uncultured Caudovirales phage TaxID=2100421 RepID=A0A6J5L2N0_9CAUD|nr:hypothetical protein UFOVP75_209 [uncultured Caudovirales phage]
MGLQDNFVNPPYGADRERGTTIKDWFKKCHESFVEFNNEIICLVPVASNTRAWRKHVFGIASAGCFLYDSHLKFFIDGIESKRGAPMACALIYYGKNVGWFNECFRKYGFVVSLKEME